MNNKILQIISVLFLSYTVQAQTDIIEDFETTTPNYNWVGDDCNVDTHFANPVNSAQNNSTFVLKYNDDGGDYANVRFDYGENFDLSGTHAFNMMIYVPSSSLTGNSQNQISLKLQNANLPEPWSTQTEIIKPITPDQWQTVSFNFNQDNYINLEPNSPAPQLRTDFNRVLIQINGEANTDEVTAYIDNFTYTSTTTTTPTTPIFDELVWQDEFNYSGAVDSDKWFHQTLLPNGNSWFNGEIQHYTNRIENAEVSNGTLKIRAKSEVFTDQGVTKTHTSARLNSKFAFTYGRVKIRAKLPTGIGTWPALWLLGQNINEDGAYWDNQGFDTTAWPACGEIDIMEHWGNNQDYVSSAIHTPSSFGGTVNYGGRMLPNASNAFHDYEMIWTPDYIEFRVDGVSHYTYEPEVKDSSTWPFDANQYLLLNVAILPSISPSFTESSLEIDYVRIYQNSTLNQAEVNRLNEVSIYPNPAKHLVYLNRANQVSNYIIYNQLGQVVSKAALVKPQINVSDLAKGVYSIKLIDAQQNTRTMKLVIQ